MILCLDLETTGVDPQFCGIIEIGAVWLHDADAPFFRACRPFPGARLEARALEVNGHTAEQIEAPERMPEALAVTEFLGWMRGSLPREERVQIAAWNASFDDAHLNASLDRVGVARPFRPFRGSPLDIKSLVAGDQMRQTVRRHVGPHCAPELLWNLGQEVKHCDHGSELLGLPPETKPHTALNGALHTRAMLLRFLGADPLP